MVSKVYRYILYTDNRHIIYDLVSSVRLHSFVVILYNVFNNLTLLKDVNFFDTNKLITHLHDT